MKQEENKPASRYLKAPKDRRNNFRRRTKATAPPVDTTEPSTDTIDTTTVTNRFTRRGNSKFKTQNGKESKTKEVENDGDRKDGGKIENRTRQPSLTGANARRSERPNRTYVRRRVGGANATTTTLTTSSSSSTTPKPAASSTRRPFRVGTRRRPVTTLSTTTFTTAKSSTGVTGVTVTAEERVSSTTPTTTILASEEELQDIDIRESIEEPALKSRNSVLKKTVKIQRRPLTSLKEPLDLNPSATNEDRNGQTKDPPTKDEERKRQSKKYSSSFKQNQLDEVIRQKSRSQEEVDGSTQGPTTDEYSAETAVAIAAHQLLSAPLPIEDSFSEQAKTNTKKVPRPTTKEITYTTDPDYTEDIPRSPGPIYRGSSYSTLNEEFSSPSYPSTIIPISGYSSGISKTSGYSSTPSYSSTSKLPAFATTHQRPSGFTTPGFLSAGFSISPALGSSTSRYLESRDKYVAVPVDDYGYTAGLGREESYFTREYLLESPVTKSYDDKYQYLTVTTPQSVTKKLPRKTFYRKISTTLGPSEAVPSTSHKPRRLAERKPFEKILKPAVDVPNRTYRPIDNYDYYDDSDEKLANKYKPEDKVFVNDKGTITCRDMGNFAHPTSCKKFISCSRREGGAFIGWEYICPVGLSFDPVGGICNWSAGLGCSEN